ncbi:hypothetical protein F4556_005821 [Kitasatospora gansuensis]|uniref:Uncharacterized protein n=1 Tax=Kitasatospora gansuensis TaxID=258050 RepID=A0A7W7SGY7_9ACTN|nr:hypothetical protein [Kitasatospora gansuensis]MBB4950286.1 hypothetical protein [Kitasatospora gansuensis]
MDESTARGVRYLLGLAPDGAGRRVCGRLRIDPDGPVGPEFPSSEYGSYQALQLIRTTPALVTWMLQQDDPRVNELLCRRGLVPEGVGQDVRDGLPFGLERTDPVPVSPNLSRRVELPPSAELVDRLRRAVGSGSLRGARQVARGLRRADWPQVVAAHQEEPFPGYARWALAEQIDCPPELRAAFGTHRKFEHRLRQAGVLGGPADLLAGATSAREALRLLGFGRLVFPTRLAEAEDVLRPLVERELGGHGEAWAVLARLLPGFAGTLPELIVTAGAVAGPAPEHEPEYEFEPVPAKAPARPHPWAVPASVKLKVPVPVEPEPEAEPTSWQKLGGLVRRILGPS